MLVDARWPPPEPEPERPPPGWLKARWPIATVVLMVVAHTAPPLLAYLCIIGIVWCAAETFALLIPSSDGLRDHKQ